MATRRGRRRNEASMSDETKAEASQVRAGQRIAKVMARAGVCSRRDAEAWIAEGRVSVNGEVLSSPAFNVSDADDVRVDGERLGAAERTRLFLFHKPRGFVTTARDPEGRPTVFDALPPGLPRVVAVGRLDINTEGLLLLTNDGGLARVLELPSTGWLRRYRVRAHGNIDQAALDRFERRDHHRRRRLSRHRSQARPRAGLQRLDHLGLREGKNREIKKVLEHLGLAVNRLIRVSFGPFELGDLAEGEAAEVRTRVLRDQLGVKLAKEAQADFDAPLIARDAPDAHRAERGRAERAARERRPASARGVISPIGTGSAGAARNASDEFDPDAAARRPAPARSTPEPRRKHVSRLRAEIAADAATTRETDRAQRHPRPQGADNRGRAHFTNPRGGAEARRRRNATAARGARKAGKRGAEGREPAPRSENARRRPQGRIQAARKKRGEARGRSARARLRPAAGPEA